MSKSLPRIKAKLTPAQKQVVLQLQDLEHKKGSWSTRVTEQDLIVRGMILLCKKHGLEWPAESPTVAPPNRARKDINWDEQPLGKVTDVELAGALGVSDAVVRAARSRRGIAAYVRPAPAAR